MHMRQWKLLFAIGICAVIASVGIVVASRTSRAATATVTVADNTFNDDASGTLTTTINAGDTVTWNWVGSALHSVTADDGSFDSGLQTAGSFSHAFDSPGTYAYFCGLHGGPGGTGMHGVVVVHAAPTDTATATATNTPTPTPTPQPPCLGDVNGDRLVDTRDLVGVARHMGSHAGGRRYDTQFDLNNDGRVNVVDLLIVLKRRGTVCR
jgi:plastocyanin